MHKVGLGSIGNNSTTRYVIVLSLFHPKTTSPTIWYTLLLPWLEPWTFMIVTGVGKVPALQQQLKSPMRIERQQGNRVWLSQFTCLEY